MIKIFTDSTYNVVVSLVDCVQTESMSDITMGVSQISFLDKKETNIYTIEIENIPEEISARVLETPDDFVYTPENGFKLRPTIKIEPSNEDQIMKISKDGAYVFPTKTNIKLRARYIDEDNVGFLDKITQIKVKDRNDFMTVPDFFDMDPEKGFYDFEVNSEYPGIAEIRAKDVNYICGFESILARFKQQ